MSTIGLRPAIASGVALILLSLLAVPAMAACVVGTSYNVNVGAPATANWTDPIWAPAGSPGTGVCDGATNTNVSTHIVVNSVITNALGALTFNCTSCVIEIQSGGQLTIEGPGVLGGDAIVKLNGGTLVVNTTAGDGGVTFQDATQLHILSGTIGGTGVINVDPTASVLYDSASNASLDGVTIKTSGSMRLAPTVPTTLTLTNGAVIDNWGFLDVETSLDIANGAGVNGILNGGLFHVLGGAETLVTTKFDNLSSGSVDIENGVLRLGGGGTGNAPFAIGGDSVLEFPADYTMLAGGSVSGGGLLYVNGGTLTIGGVTEPDQFRISSGTLTGDGFLSTRSFAWTGGTISGTGGTELAGDGTGNFSGADGDMFLDGRTLNIYGSIAYTSGTNDLQLSNGAVLGVYGTFDIQTDGSITCDCTVPPLLKIAPNGFLYKGGGSGTFLIATPSENTASVASFSGTLQFAGDGTHGGSFYASGGNALSFSAASTTFAINSNVNADGTIEFPSGNAQIDGNYDVAGKTTISGGSVTITDASDTKDFDLVTGTLTVDADFTMHGSGVWSCGTVQGNAGAFRVATGATLTIDGALSPPTLDGVELVNDGTINYTAVDGDDNYLTLSNEAILKNNGLFDIQTDAPILEDDSVLIERGLSANGVSGDPTNFINLGTLQKSAGSGTTDFEPELDTAGDVKALSGTLNFEASYTQTGGSTILGPGNIEVASGLTLDGGSLTGNGTLTGDVENGAGEIAPGTSTTTGVITITSDYAQSSGTLKTKIGGAASGQYDQLVVGGAATLDGTFTATLINSYAPADGTTFPVLTFASNSGTFATENLPTYAPNGSFTSSYNATSYDLTAVITPASADLRLQMTGPANVNAGAPLSYTIDIDNLGPDDSNGTITVANTLPAGATAASGSGIGWSCGAPVGGVITCTTGSTLLNGNTLTPLTIAMTAPANPGSVANSATVSSVTTDPASGNNTASVNTTVVALADLSITKTGPTGVTSGQNITYTVVVTNNGPSQAIGVIVSDPTPAPLTPVSNSGACVTPYPCNIGNLNAGQSATITSTYSTPPNFDGDVTNIATVSATTADPDSSDNSASITTNVGAQADLSIVKTGPSLTSPGQDITYTITVTNSGPSPATNTIVSDPSPVGVAFLSNSGACTTAYPCNVGTLNSGQSVVITSTYTVPGNYSGATVDNTASVASDVNDPDTSNNASTTSTTVLQQTDLSIVKTGPASVALGQSLTYTITVTNNGPAIAPSVVVDDPTPPGLTFASNSGACVTAYPCNLGTLAIGQSATITTTFNVPPGYPGASITNTATVSGAATEIDATDNTSTAVTTISASTSADLSIVKNGPGETEAGGSVNFVITVFNAGPATANGIVVSDPTPAGLTFTGNSGACGTPFPCNIAALGPGQSATIVASYHVDETAEGAIANTASVTSSTSDPTLANNNDSAFVAISCTPESPVLLSPSLGATIGSPVSLSWTAVEHAASYTVTISSIGVPLVITTNATNATATLPSGTYTWFVKANVGDGCDGISNTSTFIVCGSPVAPVASVVGTLTTGQSYTVQWTAVDGASSYQLEESTADAFLAPVIIPTTGTSHTFTKNVQSATPFYYRVRALFTLCGATSGPFSQTARVVVLPVPTPANPNPNVAVQTGSTQPVTFQLFIPGLPEGTTTFVATADKPWLSVTPTSGVITPDGLNVTISADPASLTNGTWTGTIVVAYGPVSVLRTVGSEATIPKIGSFPISISLVTPVTPTLLTTPGPNAFVIPAVGHLSGSVTNWFSDVRIANVCDVARQYQVTFNASVVKQTTIDIDAGASTALDDLVRNWFGVGPLGDSANGTLIIQALDAEGRVVDDPLVSKGTIISSRTYNASATQAAAGTLGQFIPATLFGNFIGRSSTLSLQQIAQSSAYRTNLGLAEAAGLPAQLNVSIFGTNGARLLQVPLSLNAGEQRQINSFLAQQGLTLPDGRIEVEVVGGDGKVTAYASVVDNLTHDPLVVSGVATTGVDAEQYVVPGVADLDTGSANWRSDVRVFNTGTVSQNATFVFYPASNPTAASTAEVSIAPGEVKVLDGILQSLFELRGVGGSLHIRPQVAPLVVTARTYNQTANGTVGQFIPAVTEDDAVGLFDGSLHIVQAEESARYRTNLGVTEVSGKPVTVEISVTLPDSKVSPTVQVPLAANEFRQLPILNNLGLGATYNARISVRVIEGEGRVSAYGSMIDRVTEDPTFVPAQ